MGHPAFVAGMEWAPRFRGGDRVGTHPANEFLTRSIRPNRTKNPPVKQAVQTPLFIVQEGDPDAPFDGRAHAGWIYASLSVVDFMPIAFQLILWPRQTWGEVKDDCESS
jgi:hypothetical protein